MRDPSALVYIPSLDTYSVVSSQNLNDQAEVNSKIRIDYKCVPREAVVKAFGKNEDIEEECSIIMGEQCILETDLETSNIQVPSSSTTNQMKTCGDMHIEENTKAKTGSMLPASHKELKSFISCEDQICCYPSVSTSTTLNTTLNTQVNSDHFYATACTSAVASPTTTKEVSLSPQVSENSPAKSGRKSPRLTGENSTVTSPEVVPQAPPTLDLMMKELEEVKQRIVDLETEVHEMCKQNMAKLDEIVNSLSKKETSRENSEKTLKRHADWAQNSDDESLRYDSLTIAANICSEVLQDQNFAPDDVYLYASKNLVEQLLELSENCSEIFLFRLSRHIFSREQIRESFAQHTDQNRVIWLKSMLKMYFPSSEDRCTEMWQSFIRFHDILAIFWKLRFDAEQAALLSIKAFASLTLKRSDKRPRICVLNSSNDDGALSGTITLSEYAAKVAKNAYSFSSDDSSNTKGHIHPSPGTEMSSSANCDLTLDADEIVIIDESGTISDGPNLQRSMISGTSQLMEGESIVEKTVPAVGPCCSKAANRKPTEYLDAKYLEQVKSICVSPHIFAAAIAPLLFAGESDRYRICSKKQNQEKVKWLKSKVEQFFPTEDKKAGISQWNKCVNSIDLDALHAQKNLTKLLEPDVSGILKRKANISLVDPAVVDGFARRTNSVQEFAVLLARHLWYDKGECNWADDDENAKTIAWLKKTLFQRYSLTDPEQCERQWLECIKAIEKDYAEQNKQKANSNIEG